MIPVTPISVCTPLMPARRPIVRFCQEKNIPVRDVAKGGAVGAAAPPLGLKSKKLNFGFIYWNIDSYLTIGDYFVQKTTIKQKYGIITLKFTKINQFRILVNPYYTSD